MRPSLDSVAADVGGVGGEVSPERENQVLDVVPEGPDDGDSRRGDARSDRTLSRVAGGVREELEGNGSHAVAAVW